MPDILEVDITGNVHVEPEAKTFMNATLYIFAEDVGLVDESARRLATWARDDVSHVQGELTMIPFTIDFVVDDPRSDHILRALITQSGVQEIQRGDLITVQAYPALLSAPGEEMILHVKEVT